MSEEWVQAGIDALNRRDFQAAGSLLESSFEISWNEGIFLYGVCSIINGNNNYVRSIDYFSNQESPLAPYIKYLKSKKDEKIELNSLRKASEMGHRFAKYYYLRHENDKNNFLLKLINYVKMALIKIDIYKNSGSRRDEYISSFDYL